jgi:hypothetical protein
MYPCLPKEGMFKSRIAGPMQLSFCEVNLAVLYAAFKLISVFDQQSVQHMRFLQTIVHLGSLPFLLL